LNLWHKDSVCNIRMMSFIFYYCCLFAFKQEINVLFNQINTKRPKGQPKFITLLNIVQATGFKECHTIQIIVYRLRQ
jgi:hypothetical protein